MHSARSIVHNGQCTADSAQCTVNSAGQCRAVQGSVLEWSGVNTQMGSSAVQCCRKEYYEGSYGTVHCSVIQCSEMTNNASMFGGGSQIFSSYNKKSGETGNN